MANSAVSGAGLVQVDPAIAAVEALYAPVVTATNQTVAYDQSIPITDLFSVSGSGITEYKIWFSDPQAGAPALGTVTKNGTPIALNQTVTVSSLSGLEYTGSATAGTDEIWLQAYDGVWGGWVEANITDPGVPPPVLTATRRSPTNSPSPSPTCSRSATAAGSRSTKSGSAIRRLGRRRSAR